MHQVGDEGVYALEITGDALAPVFRDGDRPLESPPVEPRRPPLVVRTAGGDLLVKELAQVTARSVELVSLNGRRPVIALDLTEVVWITVAAQGQPGPANNLGGRQVRGQVPCRAAARRSRSPSRPRREDVDAIGRQEVACGGLDMRGEEPEKSQFAEQQDDRNSERSERRRVKRSQETSSSQF